MNNRLKDQICKLTYNLIYPAFFGNMVYDLILRKKSLASQDISKLEFLSMLLIALFFVLDYMHVYSDLKNFESDKTNLKKSILDAFTSILIFISFVFLKESYYFKCMATIVITLGLFLAFNIKNQKITWFNVPYLICALLYAFYIYTIKSTLCLLPNVFVFLLLTSFTYGIYIFYYYPTYVIGKNSQFQNNPS